MPQNLTTPEQILGNPLRGKSFFEPDQYKIALERCENGSKSLDTQIEIWDGLAELREKHVKEIQQWVKTSERSLHELRESGTTKKVSLEMVRAVKFSTKPDEEFAKRLREDVVKTLTAYKSTNYGKSLLHLKKTSEYEKEFKKNQKPWVKHLTKVAETQQAYEELQKKLAAAVRAEKMIQSDVGKTDEEREKVKASVDKRKKDTDDAKQKHQSAREDMDREKPNYTDRMTKTLNQTHEFERQRMQQFYQSFVAVQTIFVGNEQTKNEELRKAFTDALAIHSIEGDIEQWDQAYGSKSKADWPRLPEIKE